METLRYLLLANGSLVIASLTYYGLLRHETFFRANRFLLWVSVGLALGIPVLRLPDWRPQPVRSLMQRTARVIVPRVLPVINASHDVEISPQPPVRSNQKLIQPQSMSVRWPWQQYFLVLYGVVVLLLLLRFGIRLISIRRLIRQSVCERYDAFTLVRNDRVTSPFSFFGWVAVNPAHYSPEELEYVLRHERVHIRNYHSVDRIGAELLCIAGWFNPAVYFFRWLVQQTLEFQADRAVLAEGVDARAYQYNLVKASLGGSHWALTSSFSASNLKLRIAMLNRKASAKMVWLKYPAFGLALLTAVIASGRTNGRLLTRYVPAPVARAIETPVTDTKSDSTHTHITADSISRMQIVVADSIRADWHTAYTAKSALQSTNTVTVAPEEDSVTRSPSRYIVYKGGFLYWIVTPKTTFDDLMVMKNVFKSHNHTMQVNEIRYDPLYAYIDRIRITVIRPSQDMTQVDDINDDWKPIETVAGYVGLQAKEGRSGTGELQAFNSTFPAELHTLAKEDENGVAQFAKEHRLDYLVQAGTNKFKELGDGASTYGKDFFRNKSTRSSGIIVQDDGSLTLSEATQSAPVYINNQLATPELVRALKVNQLHSVLKKSKYNPTTKESTVSGLLIYVTE